MGIRESLNKNPQITTGVTIGIIVIALGFIFYQIFGGESMPKPITQMYYTTDEGATRFADDAGKLAPFDKDGKEAVRCYIYSCDDKKTDFVAYLERLTPVAKKKIEEARAKNTNPNQPPTVDTDFLEAEGTEVKKPGTGKWVKRNSNEGAQITMVTCPGGNNDKLQIVLPQD